jgi:hypothetical protein
VTDADGISASWSIASERCIELLCSLLVREALNVEESEDFLILFCAPASGILAPSEGLGCLLVRRFCLLLIDHPSIVVILEILLVIVKSKLGLVRQEFTHLVCRLVLASLAGLVIDLIFSRFNRREKVFGHRSLQCLSAGVLTIRS